MIEYIPEKIETPARVLSDVPSGWKGLETVIGDVVARFCKEHQVALEIGVETGFSIVALSNYFDRVLGVDHFMGDEHAGLTPDGVDRYAETLARLKPYPNISLFKMDAFEFIAQHKAQYDLIHIDAKHDFYSTYVLSYWACQHSPVVIGHDITYFADVRPAMERAAKDFGRTAYSISPFNGLGILV